MKKLLLAVLLTVFTTTGYAECFTVEPSRDPNWQSPSLSGAVIGEINGQEVSIWDWKQEPTYLRITTLNTDAEGNQTSSIMFIVGAGDANVLCVFPGDNAINILPIFWTFEPETGTDTDLVFYFDSASSNGYGDFVITEDNMTGVSVEHATTWDLLND